MAIVLLSSTIKGSPNGSTVTTDAIDTTGANLLVAVYSNWATSATITDSKSGNTWTNLTGYGSASRIRIAYCIPSDVGTGHTFTATNNFPSLAVFAFSGTHSSPYDAESGNSASSVTTIQPGSLTPAEDNSLVIAGASGAGGGTLATTGFTTIGIAGDGGKCVPTAAGYLIQTTKAASNPTWTPSEAGNSGACALVVFKAAGGGVAKPVLFHSYFRSQGW
jgi:hypothetical protein